MLGFDWEHQPVAQSMTNNKLIQETFTAIVKVYFEFIHLVSSIQSLVCCLPCKVHLHLDIKETRQSPRKFKYCPVIISHAYKQITPQNTTPKHLGKEQGLMEVSHKSAVVFKCRGVVSKAQKCVWCSSCVPSRLYSQAALPIPVRG